MRSSVAFVLAWAVWLSFASMPAVAEDEAENLSAGPPLLEIVSAQRVEEATAYPYSTSFRDDQTGLVLIVKRSSVARQELYSTDYSLVLHADDTASIIPRRPCIGISRGMDDPSSSIRWGFIGGLAARTWIDEGQEFFALVFNIPKEGVTSFSLQRPVTFSPQFDG